MGKSPFLNDIRTFMRLRGMSLRTEHTYIYWVKDFIRFHRLKHPATLGGDDVMAYLGYLAAKRNVAINTQKIALNALAFLYNQFLQQPLGDLDFTFATKPRHLPEVLSTSEVAAILRELSGRDKLIFSLLFGSGLRITECLRLRVKDFNFSHGTLTLHDGKGAKDRVTILSYLLRPAIEAEIYNALRLQESYNQQGIGPSFRVYSPKSILLLIGKPPGCFCFHHPVYAITRSLALFVGTICMTLFLGKHFARRL